MIKARTIRVCLQNSIGYFRSDLSNPTGNITCARHMSNLSTKRFTIVSPDETIALLHDGGAVLDTVVASSRCKHNYLLGFKCGKSINGTDNSLESSLQSAVVAFNVSTDVNALNIDGLNISPVYLGENESRIASTRGIAISSANDQDVEKILNIREIFHKYGINTLFRVRNSTDEETKGKSQSSIKIQQLDEAGSTSSCHGNEGEDFTRDLTQPPISPVLENKKFSPIFQDLSRARLVIEKCTNWMEEAKDLLKIFDENVPSTLNLDQLKQDMKFPFVVVEGLDATGKTTLTGKIEQRLSAERYYTPPPQIQGLRKRFDDQPEVIRRAYYALGNYIVAVQILKTCQQKPVIMDRFWHSTTAYGIANETSNQDMPEEGHWVYQWPCDLLTPDLVLFLSVSEEIRQERMLGRGGENTQEEKHLKKDRLFRERLYLAYKRMKNPGCIEIDASGSVESVMTMAEAELAKLK